MDSAVPKEIEGSSADLRFDTQKMLGVAGRNWQPLQNREVHFRIVYFNRIGGLQHRTVGLRRYSALAGEITWRGRGVGFNGRGVGGASRPKLAARARRQLCVSRSQGLFVFIAFPGLAIDFR